MFKFSTQNVFQINFAQTNIYAVTLHVPTEEYVLQYHVICLLLLTEFNYNWAMPTDCNTRYISTMPNFMKGDLLVLLMLCGVDKHIQRS